MSNKPNNKKVSLDDLKALFSLGDKDKGWVDYHTQANASVYILTEWADPETFELIEVVLREPISFFDRVKSMGLRDAFTSLINCADSKDVHRYDHDDINFSLNTIYDAVLSGESFSSNGAQVVIPRPTIETRIPAPVVETNVAAWL